jgi:RHS repeat-associated protein
VAECFSYDKLNRLTQAFTTTATGCAANPAAGTANGVEPYHLAWTYDDIGNRLTETNKLTATPTTRTTTYPASGDGAARPHAATTIGAAGDPTPDTFTYDPAGNTTERTIDDVSSDFTWNVFGRLDHVDTERTTGGTTTTERTSYVYDADGERLLRKEPDATVLYLGGMELRLATGTGGGSVEATRYYTHGGAPVAVRTVDGLHWILNDTQASAEVSVDAATGATTRRRYLPFGGDRSLAGTIASWPTERGFLNKTKDSSTGLTHLGAREYDATNGRFLTPDPLVDPANQQNSAYAYSANNPVLYSDPTATYLPTARSSAATDVTGIRVGVHM